MDEQKQTKKELTPDQILEKSVRGMSNRHMSRRLKRLSDHRGIVLKKNPLSNSDIMWATVLSIVLDNRVEPFLQ
jgi:hypothetical protein